MRNTIVIALLLSIIPPAFSNLQTQNNLLHQKLKRVSPDEKPQLLFDIAHVYSELNDLSNTKRMINQSLQLAQEQKLNNLQILNLSLLAEVYRRQENLEYALNTILKAFRIEVKNDLDVTTRRNVILSRILSDMKAFHLALKYLKINRELWRTQPDNYKNFMSLSDLGVIYLKLNQPDKALTVFYEGLEYKQKDWKLKQGLKTGNGDLSNVHVYNNLGVAYFKLNQLDSALHYYRLAFKTINKIKEKDRWDELLTGYVKGNIGITLIRKKQYNEGYPYLLYDLKMIRLHGTPGEICRVESTLAEEYYIPTGQWNEAERLIMNVLKKSRENNIQNNQMSALKILSDLYRKKGDLHTSLLYLEKYISCRDEIDLKKELTTNQAFEKLAHYKIIQKNRELQLRDLEYKNTRNSFIFIISAFIGTMLLIVFFIRKKMGDQKKLLQMSNMKRELLEHETIIKQQEIEYKNKELKQYALHIIEKNNYLEQLKKNLKPIQSDAKAEQKLKQAYVSINQKLKSDSDAKQFELHLNEIHHSFLARLEMKYPDLTENEKRLCSLLVLNFSSKEIAGIFNISIAGINKSRQRLRKKLNIDPQTDLNEFLTDSFL